MNRAHCATGVYGLGDFKMGDSSSMNITKELAAMERMSVDALRGKYAAVFGEPTNARHKRWLVRRIAWRLQALDEGDLSERARRRAAELATDAELRMTTPRASHGPLPGETQTVTMPTATDHRLPASGTVIVRPYKGRTLQVLVRTDGFEFEGEIYRSLSAVAKAITGSHCNGYLFFRLSGRGRAQ